MKIHRFYIPNIEISPEKIIFTNEIELIHQLKNVFRYKVGQKIHIFNETVGEIEVEILSIDKKDMSFKYNRHIKEPDLNKGHKKEISLYMSIIKNSNFDMIIEKAVELGVSKVIPVISERVIKNKLNYERLNKIIKESTEQSGRMDIMILDNTFKIDDALDYAKNNNHIVFYGSLGDENVNMVLNQNFNKIGIFIGPEGGYSPLEINMFKEKNILPISLGKNVLRAETAAILACGLMNI